MTTITQTATMDHDIKYRSKDVLHANLVNTYNNEENEELSAYDETLPKNDPKYLAPIRRWEKRMGFLTPLIWKNIIGVAVYHSLAVVSLFYCLHSRITPKWESILFLLVTLVLAGFGVTGGAHRYWTHKSFKAKTPLKLFMLFCYSLSGLYSLKYWVRDHRVHHKFSETIADPHNANRGFFFSHVGWFLMKRHPAVIKEGSKLDLSDVTDDPIVRFHIKHHNVLKTAICFVLPTILQVYGWGETWANAILVQMFIRYLIVLHSTWSVNSFAHIWGNHPYNKYIMPAENWMVSLFSLGEGWHNYHHTFPWDYKAAELPYTFNPTTAMIDGFAKIGWAYDLKRASPTLIKSTIMNRGEH